MFTHFPLLWLFEKKSNVCYATTESLLNKAFFTSSRVRQSPSTPPGPQLLSFWVKVRLWPQLASCADAIPRRNNSCEDGVDGMWRGQLWASLPGGKVVLLMEWMFTNRFWEFPQVNMRDSEIMKTSIFHTKVRHTAMDVDSRCTWKSTYITLYLRTLRVYQYI